MCGIIGISSILPIEKRDWLILGRDSMRHRGPDGEGIFWSTDGRVGFGHRRLSILDLTQTGHQPMTTLDSQLVIVFNGEIYNHSELRQKLGKLGYMFQSTSDTEVILAAYKHWGRACVSHLHGMFAFAIYDRINDRVFLARDRAGEKPLFYSLDKGELRFASELKALTSDSNFPRHLDRRAFDCYLSMGYIPGDLCILDGVNKLPPAHTLSFNLKDGSFDILCYWQLPDLALSASEHCEDDLLEELEILLESSVQRQLVADVPVSLLLSGGVDSSLITALAARNGRRLKTFTVGFAGHADYDESYHAQLIAQHFDTDHTLLEADEVTPEIMSLLAKQYDEPLADSSMIPTFLVSQQIGQHCKVALGGDGGDELFGGYYSASRMAALQQHYSWIPQSLRRTISQAGVAMLSIEAKGRHFLHHLGADSSKDIPVFMQKFDRRERAKILDIHSKDWLFAAEGIRKSRIPEHWDSVQRVTRFDFANFMAEDILVKVDRASMLNSLEIRSPFLDASVIEFAFRKVPSSLKATSVDRKILLKKLASRILPPKFDEQRKMGFGIPLDRWLASGPWRSMFEEVLLDSGSSFSRKEVMKLFQSLDKRRPVKEHLFCLMQFELWRKEYNVSI
ncbi:asparagine synthase (glutamine-hydrolyzing) [Pseudomonadota bacterium]|nr:asparagine synthase (glutamine-hydrolyzing) [Pseudomonadota bacterium]